MIVAEGSKFWAALGGFSAACMPLRVFMQAGAREWIGDLRMRTWEGGGSDVILFVFILPRAIIKVLSDIDMASCGPSGPRLFWSI
jgi:hypothetical protein